MCSAINDLWNGNVAVCEHCGVGDPEIENLVCLIERTRNALESKLDHEQKSLLEKYIDNADEFQYLITQHAFSDGFCLACKLLTEALLQY